MTAEEIRQATRDAEAAKESVRQRLAGPAAPSPDIRAAAAAVDNEPVRQRLAIDAPSEGQRIRSAVATADNGAVQQRLNPQPRALVPIPNEAPAQPNFTIPNEAPPTGPRVASQMPGGPVPDARSAVPRAPWPLQPVEPVRDPRTAFGRAAGSTPAAPGAATAPTVVPPATAIDAPRAPSGPITRGAGALGRVVGRAAASPLGKLAGVGGGLGLAALPITAGGNYRIDDPAVDSSAGGTIDALRRGDLGAAGRSVSKGALELGLDAGGFIADTADILVPGQPFKTGYDRAARRQFGDQLQIAQPDGAAPARTASAATPRASASPAAASPTNVAPAAKPAIDQPRQRAAARASAAPAAAPAAQSPAQPPAAARVRPAIDAPAFADSGPLDPRSRKYNPANFIAVGKDGAVTRGGDAVTQVQNFTEANAAPVDPARMGMQTYGSRPEEAMVQLDDGSVLRGFDALAAINRAGPQRPQEPAQGGEQVVYTNAPNNVYKMPGTGVEIVGPGERFDATARRAVPQALAIDQVQPYLAAQSQNAIDHANPVSAAERVKLSEQRLQNEGSARSAGISAGPGYAGVKQRGEEAAGELALKRELGAKPIVVGGGQEPTFDDKGNFQGMRQVPQRVLRLNKDGLYEDAVPPRTGAIPAGAIRKLIENPKMAADFDTKYGKGAAAQALGR